MSPGLWNRIVPMRREKQFLHRNCKVQNYSIALLPISISILSWRILSNFQIIKYLVYLLHTFNTFCTRPVKNVTQIFSCLFGGSLNKNNTKSDGNPIIDWANVMEIPWFELVQNPCHVPAWKTNKTWINDMELPWNLVWTSTKLPSTCDIKLHGISMGIHVTFFTGFAFEISSWTTWFIYLYNKMSFSLFLCVVLRALNFWEEQMKMQKM